MARQVQFVTDSLYNISPTITNTPRSATPDVHRMEGLIATKIDVENEMVTASEKLGGIIRTVNALPDSFQRELITSRYLEGKGWSKIAADLNFSQSHVYRLHNAALDELGKLIADESFKK